MSLNLCAIKDHKRENKLYLDHSHDNVSSVEGPECTGQVDCRVINNLIGICKVGDMPQIHTDMAVGETPETIHTRSGVVSNRDICLVGHIRSMENYIHIGVIKRTPRHEHLIFQVNTNIVTVNI